MDTKAEAWRQFNLATERANRCARVNDRTGFLIADGQAARWLDRWQNAEDSTAPASASPSPAFPTAPAA